MSPNTTNNPTGVPTGQALEHDVIRLFKKHGEADVLTNIYQALMQFEDTGTAKARSGTECGLQFDWSAKRIIVPTKVLSAVGGRY